MTGDDIDAMIKRKGRVQFATNSLPKVARQEDHEDIHYAFKQDQNQLRKLVANCKNEDKDSKISMIQLQNMIQEAHQAQNRFEMVFGILEELEGVDAHAIEQLFYYKINGLQEFEIEAKEVTRDHKFAQLEGTGGTAKMQIQQDAIRRKALLDKIKGRKIKKI